MNTKKKILIVHNIVAPYRQPLFNSLGKDYDLYVIYLIKRDKTRRWSQDINSNRDFRIHYAKTIGFKFFGKNLTFSLNLYNFIMNFYPDFVVISDDPPHLLTSVYLAMRLKNKFPIIIWSSSFEKYQISDNYLLNSIVMKLTNTLKSYLFRISHKVLTYSQYNVAYLKKAFYLDECKIVTGLQGYPAELVPSVSVNLKQRFTNNIITFVGYIDKRKDLNSLLAACTFLHNERIAFRLRIIGDGNDVPHLKTKYEVISKHIEWHGFKDGKFKFELLNEAKCLVLPSRSDPWGWVVNEAMTLGVPCIVSDACMSKEMVDQEYIFKTGNVCQLHIKLKMLLKLDFDNYSRLSAKARDTSSNHTELKAIKAFNDIIGF